MFKWGSGFLANVELKKSEQTERSCLPVKRDYTRVWKRRLADKTSRHQLPREINQGTKNDKRRQKCALRHVGTYVRVRRRRLGDVWPTISDSKLRLAKNLSAIDNRSSLSCGGLLAGRGKSQNPRGSSASVTHLHQRDSRIIDPTLQCFFGVFE